MRAFLPGAKLKVCQIHPALKLQLNQGNTGVYDLEARPRGVPL